MDNREDTLVGTVPPRGSWPAPEDLLRPGAHSWAVLVFGLTQLTQMTHKDCPVLLNITTEGRADFSVLSIQQGNNHIKRQTTGFEYFKILSCSPFP